jgi:hypothetical protein
LRTLQDVMTITMITRNITDLTSVRLTMILRTLQDVNTTTMITKNIAELTSKRLTMVLLEDTAGCEYNHNDHKITLQNSPHKDWQ